MDCRLRGPSTGPHLPLNASSLPETEAKLHNLCKQPSLDALTDMEIDCFGALQLLVQMRRPCPMVHARRTIWTCLQGRWAAGKRRVHILLEVKMIRTEDVRVGT